MKEKSRKEISILQELKKELSEEQTLALERIGEELTKNLSSFSIDTELKEIGRQLSKSLAKFNENLIINIEDLKKGIATIEEKVPDSLVQLSNAGWYFGYDSLPRTHVKLGRRLKEGKIKEVDQFLIDYYRSESNYVEKRVIKREPRREAIIREAFSNYRDERYSSSIILFITQIDGLCYDRFEEFFFRNDPDKARNEKIYRPAIRALLNEKDYFFGDIFIGVLNRARAIDTDSRYLMPFHQGPNRHKIIHGMEVEFGTELNCLKLISLLNFVNDVVQVGSMQ